MPPIATMLLRDIYSIVVSESIRLIQSNRMLGC